MDAQCTQGCKTDQNPVLEAELWIRIHLTVQDADSYWECGSGSRGTETDKNLQRILVKPAFLQRLLYFRMYIFWLVRLIYVYFYVQMKLFVTLKSDQDPGQDPDPDPNWFDPLDADPHLDKKLDPDPDPHWNQCGSTTLLRSKLGGQTSKAGQS